MINNRQQNGRRRGRGNNQRPPQGGSGGGGRNQDNGNRIDNRSRGNAAQLLEKYKTLARDAQQAGDRVLTEYYLQFADHYFRVLADSRSRFEENQPRREGRYDGDEQGFEGEEGFEGEPVDEFDTRPQQRQPQRYERDDNRPERSDENAEQPPRREYQDRRPNGGERPQREAYPRDEAPRQDRNREDRNRDERPRDARPTNDRTTDSLPREDRPREDRPRQPRVARDADTNGVAATLGFELPPAITTAPEPDEAPAPKRRGRPKKVVTEVVVEG